MIEGGVHIEAVALDAAVRSFRGQSPSDEQLKARAEMFARFLTGDEPVAVPTVVRGIPSDGDALTRAGWSLDEIQHATSHGLCTVDGAGNPLPPPMRGEDAAAGVAPLQSGTMVMDAPS